MFDFQVVPFDFASTEVTIVAQSERGLQLFADRYGFACTSIKVRKSSAPDVAEQIEALGFTIQ